MEVLKVVLTLWHSPRQSHARSPAVTGLREDKPVVWRGDEAIHTSPEPPNRHSENCLRTAPFPAERVGTYCMSAYKPSSQCTSFCVAPVSRKES